MSKQLDKTAKLEPELASSRLYEKRSIEDNIPYRAVLESKTELIYRFSYDGTLSFVNDGFCRYFDRSSEELIGQSFMQFIPEEDRQKVENHLASLSRKNPIAIVDRRVIRPSGIIGWQQCVDRAIFDGQKRIKEFETFGRDITENILAEQDIRKNEKFFRSIFDAIQDGISVLDSDLNIVLINPTMEKWFPESVPIEGKKCYQVYHGRRKPCKSCPTIKAFESGNLEKDIVSRGVSKNKVEWFELFSFPLLGPIENQRYVVETIRNVTERIDAEHSLRESEQRFRIFADYTHNWEYWLATDGNYAYVSSSCERITGYSADEFCHDPGLLKKIIHPDDRELTAEHFKNDLENRHTKLIEFRILNRDGEVRWIKHVCNPVFDDERQFLGRRVSNQDITERKAAEKALRKAHQDLEHRVEERTLQLKNAAKELKSGQRELLKNKSKLEKVNKELLETNRAISVLARNIDKNRQEVENTIAKAINSKIMPIVEDLRKAKNLESRQGDLDILAANIQSLTSDLTGGVNLMASLTQTELRIATMIKNGLKNQEIADRLYISLHTAKTHRRNIRKKLNITNSRINLASYLQSIMW